MKKNKAYLFINSIMFLMIILGIIIYPENAYNASLNGLNLWFNVVCPSLLPFFICLDILIKLGLMNFLAIAFQPVMSFLFNMPGEGAFAFIMSISSGYPVGAKIIAKLRKEKICSKIECQRMINFCSTSGPLFIIGAVSIGILKNPSIASTLLIAHYLSAIIIGFLMRFYNKDKASHKSSIKNNFLIELSKYKNKSSIPLGQIIAESIINSINLILLIGGYIILFSVISNTIQETGLIKTIAHALNSLFNKDIVSSNICHVLFTGILEVVNGVKEAASLNIPYLIKIAMISFFIGFGGLSVNAQVSGIIYETDINFPLYLIIKVIQGVIAAALTLLLLYLPFNITVFNNYLHSSLFNNLTWYCSLKFSLILLALLLVFLIIFFCLALLIYLL